MTATRLYSAFCGCGLRLRLHKRAVFGPPIVECPHCDSICRIPCCQHCARQIDNARSGPLS